MAGLVRHVRGTTTRSFWIHFFIFCTSLLLRRLPNITLQLLNSYEVILLTSLLQYRLWIPFFSEPTGTTISHEHLFTLHWY